VALEVFASTVASAPPWAVLIIVLPRGQPAAVTATEALRHLTERITELEVCELAPVALQLGGLLVTLAARMATTQNGKAEPPDRLLDAEEACALLGGVSKDHLYNAAALRPVRVKVGRRVLFSWLAIQKLIARRTGR
jgi:hypothetical protein